MHINYVIGNCLSADWIHWRRHNDSSGWHWRRQALSDALFTARKENAVQAQPVLWAHKARLHRTDFANTCCARQVEDKPSRVSRLPIVVKFLCVSECVFLFLYFCVCLLFFFLWAPEMNDLIDLFPTHSTQLVEQVEFGHQKTWNDTTSVYVFTQHQTGLLSADVPLRNCSHRCLELNS